MRPWEEVGGEVLQSVGLGEFWPLHFGGPGGERPGLLGDDLGPLPWRGFLVLPRVLGSRLALAGFRWGSRAPVGCGAVLKLRELRGGLQAGFDGAAEGAQP